MYDGMNDLKEWEFNQINHYDSKMVIDEEATLSEIDDVADEVDGDKIMESAIEIESPSAKKSGSLLVLDGTDLVTPTDYDWNKVEIKDDDTPETLQKRVMEEAEWEILPLALEKVCSEN